MPGPMHTECSFVLVDREFQVSFHLPDGQVQERTYGTIPSYSILWQQVHKWVEKTSFTISLDDVVLTNKNTASQLREVVGVQDEAGSQLAAHLTVAWRPSADAEEEQPAEKAVATCAANVRPAEPQPSSRPPWAALLGLGALGAAFGALGLAKLLRWRSEFRALKEGQDSLERSNRQLLDSKNEALRVKESAERRLRESEQNNRALTQRTARLQDEKEEKEALLQDVVKQRKIEALGESVKRYQDVDLLFMVDCTGSMQPYIDQVKGTIHHMVRRLKSAYPKLKLRVGFLGYRDVRDARQFEVLDFTDDVEAFARRVANVFARGGADDAEDVAGALRKAVGFGWRRHVRVLFHIADMPCHGREYHGDQVTDNHPSGVGISIPQQLLRLRSQKVNYYFGRIKEHTDKMIRVFNEQVHQSGSEPFVKMVAIDNPLDVQEAVVRSVCTSIDLSSSPPKTFKKELELVLSPEQPEWHLLEARPCRRGRRLSWEVPSCLADCGAPLGAARAAAADFVVHSEPFAQGMSRRCFWGLHRRRKKEPWTRAVFKQFRKGPEKGRHDDYEAEVEKALVAEFFARKYSRRCKPTRKIRVLVPDVIEDKEGRAYCVEEVLPRGFVKYNDNKASWDPKVYDPVLGDFCRWTYEFSAGAFMVVDLQGVSNDEEFILTDPAILHSDVRRFGSTNTGPEFMRQTLESIPQLLSKL
ncbi:vwkA [Symbiodinium natans]|uniref:VwkA protein n=1 Tax=Symbiodinium natans TaxID=878477 RepID=A0A812UN53_9DINO|nr:vwkA [Symbiodinium natans]